MVLAVEDSRYPFVSAKIRLRLSLLRATPCKGAICRAQPSDRIRMTDPTVTTIDLRGVEPILEMSAGYVLDFSDRTFASFFTEYGVSIDAPIFQADGSSKANRLRCFLKTAPPVLAGSVLAGLLEHRLLWKPDGIKPKELEAYRLLLKRLEGDSMASNPVTPEVAPILGLPSAPRPQPFGGQPWWQDRLALSPAQVELVDRLWRHFRTIGTWPERKPLLLEYEKKAQDLDSLMRSGGIWATQRQATLPELLRVSFDALLHLPEIREHLAPMPAVVREACRRFISAPNFRNRPRGTRMLLSEMLTFWREEERPIARAIILQTNGHPLSLSGGTDADPWHEPSFRILAYEAVESLEQLLLPINTEVGLTGEQRRARRRAFARRIFGHAVQSYEWPGTVNFAIANRDLGSVPDLADAFAKPKYLDKGFSDGYESRLELRAKAMELLDADVASLALRVIHVAIAQWETKDEQKGIPLKAFAEELNLKVENVAPILLLLEREPWVGSHTLSGPLDDWNLSVHESVRRYRPTRTWEEYRALVSKLNGWGSWEYDETTLEDAVALDLPEETTTAMVAVPQALGPASRLSDNFDVFLKRAKPNFDRKCGAKFSCICIRRDDRWINMATTIILGPPTPDAMRPPLVVDFDGFRAIEGAISPDQVEPLLAGIRSNGVADPAWLPTGIVDPIFFFDENLGSPYQFSQAPTFEQTGSALKFDFDWPSWSLKAWGPPMHSLMPNMSWEAVELALPAASPGFAGIDDLAEHIGIVEKLNSGRSASLNILSPYWLRLDEVVAQQVNATLTVSIRTRWEDVAGKASLLLLEAEARSLGRRRAVGPAMPIAVGGATWKVTSEASSSVLTTQLKPHGKGPWDVFLNFEGQRIGVARAGLGSARLVAHQLIDPNFEELRDRLAPKAAGPRKGNRAESFEEGVGWLFHLCGLHVARYGYQDVQQAVDLVAFLGDVGALYVECSVEFPPGEKVTKLKARGETFRATMAENHRRDIHVGHLIAIPSKRSQLSDVQVAGIQQAGVGLLCAEDLEDMLNRALVGEPPVVTFSRLATLSVDQSARDANALLLIDQLDVD